MKNLRNRWEFMDKQYYMAIIKAFEHETPILRRLKTYPGPLGGVSFAAFSVSGVCE